MMFYTCIEYALKMILFLLLETSVLTAASSDLSSKKRKSLEENPGPSSTISLKSCAKGEVSSGSDSDGEKCRDYNKCESRFIDFTCSRDFKM